MERTDCARWVLIVGGAGAVTCLAWTLLAEQERRQRRRQSGARKRLAVDKLQIQAAIDRGVQKKKEAMYQSMNGVWQGAMLKQTLERDEAYFAPRVDDSLHEPADNVSVPMPRSRKEFSTRASTPARDLQVSLRPEVWRAGSWLLIPHLPTRLKTNWRPRTCVRLPSGGMWSCWSSWCRVAWP